MITVEQIRAARAMLGLKQAQLAKLAGISTGTLNNIERGVQTDPKISTLRAIKQALEAKGITFTNMDAGGLGIQMKNAGGSGNAPTLLIIDDNKTDRTLYKAWLNSLDKKYTIVEATDAMEGYDAFIKHQPACIILDFMMYGKNGFQMLVEMKKEHAEIPPIVFVTAMHNEMIEKDAETHGVHTYLNKNTLTKETLCKAVAEALA